MKEDAIHFLQNRRIPYVQIVAGQSVRNVFPLHTHSTVNIGTIIKGRARFLYKGQERIIKAGDVYFVPPKQAHSLAALDGRGFSHTVLCVQKKAFYESLNLSVSQSINPADMAVTDTNLSKKINAFAVIANDSKTTHIELETRLWETIEAAVRVCGINVVVPQSPRHRQSKASGPSVNISILTRKRIRR